MTRSLARSAAFTVVGLSAVAGAPAFASNRTPVPTFPLEAETPLAALQDVDVIEHTGDKIPSGLTFRDPEGHNVEIDGLLGNKPLLVTLGYYRCPMLCNLVLDGLVKSMKAAGLAPGKDFQALSISIDPKEDVQQAVATRTRVHAAAGQGVDDAAWPFLMGDAVASRLLADAVGFKYAYDAKSGQFAHDAVTFVLTPEGRISRYLYGVDVLPRDFRLALVEAAGGRVGTSFDRLLLSCFQYDPLNRKYAPYALGFVRIGSGMVFLMLVGLLTVLWRKEMAMRRRRVA